MARADDPRGPWTSTSFDAAVWCVACDGDDVYALCITPRGTVVAVGNGPLWGCVDASLAR